MKGLDHLLQKDWSAYPFIPPLFSLLLTLIFLPTFERLLDQRLFSYLKDKQRGDHFELTKAVIENRTLQLAYLTEIPVFATSVIVTLQSNSPKLMLFLALLGLLFTVFT